MCLSILDMSATTLDEMEKMFWLMFKEKKNTMTQTGVLLAEEEYIQIAKTLLGWETISGAERSQRNKDVGNNKAYRWATRFSCRASTLDGHQVLTLLSKVKGEGGDKDNADDVVAPALDSMLVVLHEGNLFKTLHEVHVQGGHAKGRAFEKRVKEKFSRVPRWAHEFIVACCAICIQRRSRPTMTAGHTPILTRGFGSRGQVDLIDFQSCPDGEFKFLLNYQDHGIKLYDNRPLTSKRAGAVAFALLDIFSFIGPPCLLQADNGREFSNVASKAPARQMEEGTEPIGRGKGRVGKRGQMRGKGTKRKAIAQDSDDSEGHMSNEDGGGEVEEEEEEVDTRRTKRAKVARGKEVIIPEEEVCSTRSCILLLPLVLVYLTCMFSHR